MSEFKIGDKVTVVKKLDMHGVGWCEEMDEFIGTEIVIDRIDYSDDSVKDRDSGWWFPFGSLEHLPSKYIDGTAVSIEEFNRRTAEPVEMTEDEVSAILGFPVKIK